MINIVAVLPCCGIIIAELILYLPLHLLLLNKEHNGTFFQTLIN